jgi:predicted RecB family nuclease
MKSYTITTLSEIAKGNSRFCLSAKRGLKRCHACSYYPECESRISNKAYDGLIELKSKAAKRAETLRLKYVKKIEEIGGKV